MSHKYINTRKALQNMQYSNVFRDSKIFNLYDNPQKEVKDKILLLQQFFIPQNKIRYKEIKYCLKQNLKCNYISEIHLLNERIYTDVELGLNEITSSKLTQVNIKNRLKYKDIIEYVKKINWNGYVVFSNSDIFLDNTLENLYTSSLSYISSWYCQLRFEYHKGKKLEKCKIFGPRADSQDTWIFHTNHNIPEKYYKLFDFELGRPGCDNKIIYILNFINYKFFNEPFNVKTYHYHMETKRNYTIKDRVNPPYALCNPHIP